VCLAELAEREVPSIETNVIFAKATKAQSTDSGMDSLAPQGVSAKHDERC
jgi:hypothetical protein